MSRLRIVIQRIEDDTQPERVTELDRIEVPHLDARSLEKETALDHLETQTLAHGQAVMRHLLVRQWEGVEQQLVASYRSFFPLSPMKGDGHDPLKVASRVGILQLPRQVLERADGGGTSCPGMTCCPSTAGW
jgi:hypothetical protein